MTGLAMVLAPIAAGCGASGSHGNDGTAPGPTNAQIQDAGATNPAATSIATGVVVIDVQESFVAIATRRNPKRDLPAVLARTKHVFETAVAKHAPFFITYEAATTGDHALASSLGPALPPDAQSFIKTTFAATGQPKFAAAVQSSGVKRVLVLGAETDVCVLQTMLGLRRAGFDVVTALDTLFTEEVNVAPAVRRMQQAGISIVDMDRVDAVIAGEAVASASAPPAGAGAPAPVIVRSLEMGVVLHDLERMTDDANDAAKKARLRELLMLTEWFSLPVYATDPARANAALPAELKSILSRPIQPLSSRAANVTQLAVAGAHAGAVESAASLQASGVDVFLVTDALVGGTFDALESAWTNGAIPTTYKTLYYELTKSVSDAEWPAQSWVTAGDKWYDLTSAPEDLPPIVESR